MESKKSKNKTPLSAKNTKIVDSKMLKFFQKLSVYNGLG